jgi:two-component system nitrogen regulation response regulator GlnG
MTPQHVENAEKFPGAAGKPPATVLVVDDEPLTCWSIAEVLVERGYHVRKAGDASSALQAIATADPRPDLVLLDMRLPDSSDLTVLSVIHRSFPRLPVVLMTAHGSQALSAEARRRGAVAVVNKPFEIHALAPMVEELLAGTRS